MLQEFRKFIGNKVLEFFLTHPSIEIHIRELSRKLGISSGSAKHYCDLLKEENILHSKKKGNLKIFFLNDSDFAVKELKKAYYMFLLREIGIERLKEGCISLAVYGSFASGKYDEQSDLDILVVGKDEEIDKDMVLQFQETLGKEIQLTIIPYYKWEKMKKEKDSFAETVLRNHVLIGGTEL